MNRKLLVGPACPGPTQVLAELPLRSRMGQLEVRPGLRYQSMQRSRFLVRPLVTSSVVAAAVALAGCTFDGTPASSGNPSSIGTFVRGLFGSKSEDHLPVAHDEARVEPSGPKAKPATSKPKHPAAAAARAHPAKPRPQPANTETAIARAPKPSPKQASAEPQSTPGSATPPLLSGAAPTLPVGSFDDRFSPSR
jgi:cell division septation protein DedD